MLGLRNVNALRFYLYMLNNCLYFDMSNTVLTLKELRRSSKLASAILLSAKKNRFSKRIVTAALLAVLFRVSDSLFIDSRLRVDNYAVRCRLRFVVEPCPTVETDPDKLPF